MCSCCLKKTKKAKQKKRKRKDSACKELNFPKDNIQLLIPEIVVHSVHEYK